MSTNPAIPENDPIDQAAGRLEGLAPEVILKESLATFGSRIGFATGFGPEGCVLIDVIARHRIPIDVFTLDTGLLFGQTHTLWRDLEARYGIEIRGVVPRLNLDEQAAVHGERLWERAPDGCCALRKVEPLAQELAGLDAWITAIRRDQTKARASARVVERDPRFDLVKINPLVAWTHDQVWDYIRENDVPTNALHDQGYPSIGCWPCTSPVSPGEDARAGRWRNRAKTECGLHTRPGGPAAQVLDFGKRSGQ